MRERMSPRIAKHGGKAAVAVGALAILAIAVPGFSEEGPKKDEVFHATTIISVPGGGPFFSFDISWTDASLNKYFLADRNHKAIDVIDPANLGAGITQFPNPGFAGFTGNNDTSGPDGVLTANN